MKYCGRFVDAIDMYKFAHIVRILLLSLWITVSAGPLFGCQDDPFDPFATDDADVTTIDSDTSNSSDSNPPIDNTLGEGVKLVIKNLRMSDPKTPDELVRAVKTLLNVRQYGEAKKYLNQLAAIKMDDFETFQFLYKVGPDVFLKLRDQKELQPE